MSDRIVTLDYETFFDPADKYGFAHQTTEEYIRDRRWQTIGVGVQVGHGTPQWCTGTEAQIADFLRSLRLEECGVVMQNAMFDAAVLNWRHGIRPKRIFDTMSMARGAVGLRTGVSLKALGKYFQLDTEKGDDTNWARGMRREDFTPQQMAQYGRYCCNDVAMTWQLFLKLLPMVSDSELRLIDWTIRAFSEPALELDGELIDLEYRAYLSRRAGLLAAAGVHDIAELRSDDRMAELLISLGVKPPTKPSPKQVDEQGQPKEVWAFAKSDVAFMDLRDDEDERVVALVEARLGSKTSQVQSRLERFAGIARRGPLPVPLLYAGATPTRRWSGTDKINLQNLPRSKAKKDANRQTVLDARGKPIIVPSPLRRAIRAPKGMKMAVGDLSQIELRVNAWQAGQSDVLRTLASGGDTYSDMATDIFGFEVNKYDHPVERFVGKTAELGCGYQCGREKFHTMLLSDSRKYDIALPDESPGFAHGVVDIYRGKRRAIRNFWYAAGDALEPLAMGGVRQLGPYLIRDQKIPLPDGSHLYYPELAFREKKGANEQGCEWSYMRMRGRSKVQTKMYGGKLVENITQAVARLFVSDALLRLQTVKYRDGRPVFKIVSSVHDELLMLYEEGLDDAWVKDTMHWAFTTCPSWAPDIPLEYEGEVGYNYAEVK